MKNNPIVFTMSGKAGSGKDTSAEIMCQYLEDKYNLSVLKLAYADFLKVICARNFGYDESDKVKSRNILQYFGTDICRTVNPRIWVDTVWHLIDSVRNVYDVIIITDARYDNELSPSPYYLSYPIINVLINRDRPSDVIDEEGKQHSSEELANQPDITKFHFIVDNNQNIEYLANQLHEMIETIIRIDNRILEIQRTHKTDDKIDEVMKLISEIYQEVQNGNKGD